MGASNPRIKTNSLDLPASRLAFFLDPSARGLVGFTTLNTHSLHSGAVLSSIFFGCIRLAHVNQSPLSSCLCVTRLGCCRGIYALVSNHQSQAVRFWEKSTPWLVAFFLLVFAGIQSGKWLHEQ